MKLNAQINRYVDGILIIANRNPFTNVYGLSRSILAMGTLVTFLFNDVHSIFIDINFGTKKYFFLEKINIFYLFGYENISIAKIVCVIILLFIISGFFPQITGLLHWWVTYSFFNSAIIVDGGDQIASVITLLLIPITLLDSRINHWRFKQSKNVIKNYTAILFIFLIQIQMCILYFNSAIAKFTVEEWTNGTAIYYWLLNNTFGVSNYLRKIIFPIITNAYGVQFLTWGTIAFEILLFASLFFNPKNKIKMLKAGLLFHFFIFIFLGLGSFFFSMAGGLILYLYPFDNWIKINFVFKKFFYGNRSVLRRTKVQPKMD
ncbi:MAG: sporulation-delaying protein SdpB family protein [Chitinophagaceae bacterium]